MKRIYAIVTISMLIFLLSFSFAHAQYWTSLPPYNTLWPLWSPALSPIDPSTGLAIPIIDNLNPSTVLPVQPGLTWDPAWAYPWLLYNTPSGLGYFDQIYGFNMWPPAHLLNAPLVLKGPWQNLPPTLIDWGQQYVPLANLTYSFLYDIDPASFGLLLTPSALWGL